MAQSIYNLSPIDQSGRMARRGFIYQDHVGAFFLLEMLENKRINEIWLEKEDDITLLKTLDGKSTVEFIQVKHNKDKTSRWSISDVCLRKKDRIGTSLFEKLLAQDRCSEPVLFRIVSSYDITSNHLSHLKLVRGSIDRKNRSDKADLLIKELNSRLANFKSLNGKSWSDFEPLCKWDVFPRSVLDIDNNNKIKLENYLISTGVSLLRDQRDELYSKILGKIRFASTCDLLDYPGGYKIELSKYNDWIKDELFKIQNGASETKLRLKLEDAGVSEETIKAAEYMRIRYKGNRYTQTYVRERDLQDLEDRIIEILHGLKIELDTGVLQMNGAQFHLHCLKEVESKVLKQTPFVSNFTTSFGKGLMYDVTNRCIHRFNSVGQ